MSGTAIALCAVWGVAVVISVIATIVSYVRTGKINTGLLNLFSLFSPPTPNGAGTAEAEKEKEPEKPAKAEDATPIAAPAEPAEREDASGLDEKVRSALVSVLKLALEELRDDAAGQPERSDRVNWVLGGGK